MKMPPSKKSADPNSKQVFVAFDKTKGEVFSYSEGFSHASKKLSQDGYRVFSNEQKITPDMLKNYDVFVLCGPREKFTTVELDSLRNHVGNGGSLLIMMAEGGEKKLDTNINYLLEEYGIMVNTDSVINNSCQKKYYYPKESLVLDGVLNRSFTKTSAKWNAYGDEDRDKIATSYKFVYPYGATLNVAKPGTSVLSTGSFCFPLSRPVCAFYENVSSSGKIAVLGSAHMFTDKYIQYEDNVEVFMKIILYLTTNDIVLNSIDAESPEILDYQVVPSVEKFVEQPFCCLQECEMLPADFVKKIWSDPFQIDNKIWPKVLRCFEELKVKHEPLTIIKPAFIAPIPSVKPAVFPPLYRKPDRIALELFDLDDMFGSSAVRLAQLTNKCSDEDLEYYIQEAGKILNVTQNLPSRKRTAKDILQHIFTSVTYFKRTNYNFEDSFSANLANDINGINK